MDTQLSSLLSSGPFGDLVFAVQYGSGQNDVDVMAVYELPPFQGQVMLGSLDCFALSKSQLAYLLDRLDPAVTEPVIKGQLLAGSADRLAAFRRTLSVVHRSPDVVRHLVGAAFASYRSAEASVAKLRQAPSEPLFRLFWKNLSWAASYLAYAAFYDRSSGTGPVSPTELLPQSSADLRAVWKLAQRRSNGPDIQACEDALFGVAVHVARGVG